MTKPKIPWIRIDEAIEILAAKLGESEPRYEGVEAIIIKGFREGRFGSRGKTMKIPRTEFSEVCSHDITWGKHPSSEIYFKRNQPDSPLAAVDDKSHWNTIYEGFIVFAEDNESDHWNAFFDIELRKPDFLAYLDNVLRIPLLDVTGRPRKADEWLAVTAALLKLERLGYLNCDNFPDDMSLRKTLSAVSPEGLDERSIRPDVRALFEIFVKDKPAGDGGKQMPRNFELDIWAELHDAKSRLFSKPAKR